MKYKLINLDRKNKQIKLFYNPINLQTDLIQY